MADMGLTLLVSSVGAYDELIPEKGDENTAVYLAQLLYLYNRQVFVGDVSSMAYYVHVLLYNAATVL
jgi:hypothetical protein